MKFTQVDPARINLKDDRFRFSLFTEEDSDLTDSIREVGLLNPPILAPRARKLTLVSGWKRVLSCLALALPVIPVFRAETEDDLELFKTAVYENASLRTFTAIEKAEILSRLKEFGAPEEDLVRRFLPLLKIPPTPSYLEIYLSAAAFLSEEKRIIHQKDMTETVLKSLIAFAPDEREELLPWLQVLGRNKQKELLELVWEIARRDLSTPLEILSQPLLEQTRQDEALSLTQKADRVIDILRLQRSPGLSAWRQAFSEALKKLRVDQGILVDPGRFFEGEDLSLCFRFRNRDEFLDKLAQLAKMADKSEFKGLFPESEDE
jgi:hypothetical protein